MNHSHEPLSGHSSSKIINDINTKVAKTLSRFRPKHRERGIEMHTTLHETFPSLVPSEILSSDRLAHEVSDLSMTRTADLVRQPSRWGAELPRAIGLNPRGYKASLILSSLPTSKPHTSSNYLNDNGMELLSEACAAVITPKFLNNVFEFLIISKTL